MALLCSTAKFRGRREQRLGTECHKPLPRLAFFIYLYYVFNFKVALESGAFQNSLLGEGKQAQDEALNTEKH